MNAQKSLCQQKLWERGGSLSACIASRVLRLSIPFWPHSGHGATWSFAPWCDNCVILLMPLKFLTDVFIFICALFRIFRHCLKWETQTYQYVCPSQIFKIPEKQPSPHLQRDCCPRKSLLGWERPWGTDSHLPPPHTPCGALEKGPCRPCHASASPASPPRTCRPWAASSSCE